jgi:hypothetical protein
VHDFLGNLLAHSSSPTHEPATATVNLSD